MLKGILKTAAITALAFISIFIISVFSIFAFAPKFSAKICHDLGMKKLATSCLEREYEKKGTLEDLIEVIDSAVYSEEKDKVAKYGVLLFEAYNNTVAFADYCAKEDADIEEDEYSTYDYYANTVFMVLYNQGEKEQAAEFAIINIIEYSDKSALKRAVVLANPTHDKEFGDTLVSVYKSLMKDINTSAYNDFRIEMRKYKDAEGKSVYKF